MSQENPQEHKITKIEAYKVLFNIVWSILLFLLVIIFNDSRDTLKDLKGDVNDLNKNMIIIIQNNKTLSEKTSDQENRIRKLETNRYHSDFVNRGVNSTKKQ